MTNRVKRVELDPQSFFVSLREGDAYEVERGIPEGAKFRGFVHDYMTNKIVLFIEHESFEEVPEGEIPPALVPILAAITPELSNLRDTRKVLMGGTKDLNWDD